jgi:hypothetical protein
MPRKRHSREINLIKTSQTDTSERRNTYQRFRTVLNSVLKKREKKLKEGEELYNLFCLEKKGKTDLSHRRRRRSARPGARGGARARAARCCRRWPASGRWSPRWCCRRRQAPRRGARPRPCWRRYRPMAALSPPWRVRCSNAAMRVRGRNPCESRASKVQKSKEPSVEREGEVQGSRKDERCVKRESSEEGNVRVGLLQPNRTPVLPSVHLKKLSKFSPITVHNILLGPCGHPGPKV